MDSGFSSKTPDTDGPAGVVEPEKAEEPKRTAGGTTGKTKRV